MHIDELLMQKPVQRQENTTVLDPLGDGISSLELVRISGSDLDVVNAARVSYGKVSPKLSERDEKLVEFLIEYQHTSPFEHNQLSFRVKAPILVARQWMRHRISSYNELSYRYAKAKFEFYIPSSWRTQDKINKQASGATFTNEELLTKYKQSIDTAINAYQKMLENGVCRELARGILPVCIYTEFIYTCNLHSLMHFLRLRLDPGAQHEIRAYAQGLLQLAEPYFPISLKVWKKHSDLNSSFE